MKYVILFLAVVLCAEEPSAVTFEKVEGSFEDNLLSYLHALWISYKFQLPLLSPDDAAVKQYAIHKHPTGNADFTEIVRKDCLYTIPYHPDFRIEAANVYGKDKRRYPFFVVDWEDRRFLELVREHILPKDPGSLLSLPQDRIRVAVHVRRGLVTDRITALKFPSDTFYVQAVRKISALFKHKPLHVHVFADDDISNDCKSALCDLDITFSFRQPQHPLEDFFAMRQFDCLVYPLSNYSYIPSRIWGYKVRIAPRVKGMQIEVDR